MSDTVRAGERELIEGREHQYEPGTTCWCGQANHILESEYERGRRDGLDGLNMLLKHYREINQRGFPKTAGREVHVLFEAYATFLRQLEMVAATSGTPAEHNPARAPHNKFASLWCDACPRPASGTPAPVDWNTWFCDAHKPIQSHATGTCFVCNALKPAPPPADETLPAGEKTRGAFRSWADNFLFPKVHPSGYSKEMENHVACLTNKLMEAAQPSGAQAAAPTTTNVREAFEKWYAAYKDITLYIDGMQDAFEAGYNARSNERDAQAAPGPKCSHGVLMREFCQGCEDAP